MKISLKGGMVLALLAMVIGIVAGGCSPVKGKRYWWDDQKKEDLPDSYMLPEWPAEAPVPTDPAPYVPNEVPADEVQRATKAQHELINKGIPRCGVADPDMDRVKVPVAKWEGGSYEESAADVTEKDGKVTVSEDTVKEKNGNIKMETESETLDLK